MLPFIVYFFGLWIVGYKTWRDRIKPWMSTTNDSNLVAVLITSIVVAFFFMPFLMAEAGAWTIGLPFTACVWFALLSGFETNRRSKAREIARHTEFLKRMRTQDSDERAAGPAAAESPEAQLPWYLRTETRQAIKLSALIKAEEEDKPPLPPEEAQHYGVAGQKPAETARLMEIDIESGEKADPEVTERSRLVAKAQSLGDLWRRKQEEIAPAPESSAARQLQRPMQRKLSPTIAPVKPVQPAPAARRPAPQEPQKPQESQPQAAPEKAQPAAPVPAAAPAPTAPVRTLPPIQAPSTAGGGVESRFARPASAPPPAAKPPPAAAPQPAPAPPPGGPKPAPVLSSPGRFTYKPQIVDSKLGGAKPASK